MELVKKKGLWLLAMVLAVVMTALCIGLPTAKAEEPPYVYTVDASTPYTIGVGGYADKQSYGSARTEKEGKIAYDLALRGGDACRMSSTVGVDLTTLEFDIFNASKMVQATYPSSTMIGLTDGVNRYMTEYQGGITLMIDHTVAEGVHKYVLGIFNGWVGTRSMLADGTEALKVMTDPADDKITIKMGYSEDKTTFDVCFNEVKMSLKASQFDGTATSGVKYYDGKDMTNVYPIFGTMAKVDAFLTLSEMRDSKTKGYVESAPYTAAMANLSAYQAKFAGDGINTAEKYIETLEINKAFNYTGLRDYSIAYLDAQRAVHNDDLAVAKAEFESELIDYDIKEYETAVGAIVDVKTALEADKVKKNIRTDVINLLPDGAEKTTYLNRIIAADALFKTKTDAAAIAVSADAVSKINVADSAAKVNTARTIYETITPAFLALVSTEANVTVSASKTAFLAKLGEVMTVDKWNKNGNAILMKNANNALSFHGKAYSGIDSATGIPYTNNDVVYSEDAFQITNFSMEFKANLNPSGWFGISLMAKKGDVFSATGEGEAATGKHQGIMIWLEPKSATDMEVSVFALKNDSTNIYTSRKTEIMPMAIPADGKFTLRMYNMPGTNNLSMMLNGKDILVASLRLAELNTIFGAKTDPNAHKGYITINCSTSDIKDNFDYEFSKINSKNIFAADITTPDPANIPEKEVCQHDYDAETGYCSICGELDPNFGKGGITDKGCGGCGSSVIATSGGIIAVIMLVGVAFFILRRKSKKLN